MKGENSKLEFIGYDLGHGETAVGRAPGSSAREPVILEHMGEKSFVTAVSRTKENGKTQIRIGAQAVNISALGTSKNEVWVKFKSRDVNDALTREPTLLFTKKLFEDLSSENRIQGMDKSRVMVGCPSGWEEDDRTAYQNLMVKSGLKAVRVVPESRAALMTAIEQGYISLDAARSSVLIVDIGSSTTDFTYCMDLETEDVGHNILGSGLLDTLIFERCLARQADRAKIEKLVKKFPHYRPILEYWCRLAKEQYFNGDDTPVEMIKRLPVSDGTLFEIRIDKGDAKAILEAPIAALNDFTWPATFSYALKESVERLGGREPETVLLTGGASRLPLVAPACERAFPNAKVVRGAEPEFAIARGLAWLGRFEYLHASFTKEVENLVGIKGEVRELARNACAELGEVLSPALVDALIDSCVVPAFGDWRKGEIKNLSDVEAALDVRVQEWLASPEAQSALRPAIENWFAGLQRDIEKITDPLCRDHGLPAMVLSLDDSAHISKHLEGLSVAAPHVASLESDTALAGTTVSAVLIGVLLAKANLLAPLLANPIGIAVGGIAGVGGYVFGRKALEGKLREANVPVLARKLVTDRRIRQAAKGKREELIKAVAEAWSKEASPRFAQDLIAALKTAFLQRANERAVLFLL
jgi:hypothetical protein